MKARKVSEFILLTAGLLALCHIALADGVRTVYVKPNSIEPIYLSMGKSTVLRFRDHPRKIVIGNQNYFGVEFIENDVALQPLGQIKTNMFVYTETRTYGFYLIVGQGRSDDLAKVEWQPLEIKSKEILKPMTPMISMKKITGISVKLNNDLRLTPFSIQYSPDHRMYVLDLNIENISEKEIILKDVTLLIAKDKLSLSKQILVKEVEQLKSKQKSRLRLFFGCEAKSDLNVILTNNKARGEFILKRTFL
jgi:hypothetical protein